MSVIYKIINIETAKFYVGSTIDLKARWRTHRRLLKAGKHHCPHLQHAWSKYGPDSFVLRVVEEVPDAALLMQVEQRWLDESHAAGTCYNFAKYVDSSARGVTFLPSHRQAISKGVKAFLDANGHPMAGIPRSAETIAKISAAKVGIPKTAAHKEKLRAAFLGRTASAETKAKLSAQRKGKPKSAAHIAKYNKAVVELTAGARYESLKAVKAHYGMSPGLLDRALSSDKPISKGKHVGLHFRYAA